MNNNLYNFGFFVFFRCQEESGIVQIATASNQRRETVVEGATPREAVAVEAARQETVKAPIIPQLGD